MGHVGPHVGLTSLLLSSSSSLPLSSLSYLLSSPDLGEALATLRATAPDSTSERRLSFLPTRRHQSRSSWWCVDACPDPDRPRLDLEIVHVGRAAAHGGDTLNRRGGNLGEVGRRRRTAVFSPGSTLSFTARPPLIPPRHNSPRRREEKKMRRRIAARAHQWRTTEVDLGKTRRRH